MLCLRNGVFLDVFLGRAFALCDIDGPPAEGSPGREDPEPAAGEAKIWGLGPIVKNGPDGVWTRGHTITKPALTNWTKREITVYYKIFVAFQLSNAEIYSGKESRQVVGRCMWWVCGENISVARGLFQIEPSVPSGKSVLSDFSFSRIIKMHKLYQVWRSVRYIATFQNHVTSGGRFDLKYNLEWLIIWSGCVGVNITLVVVSWA